MSLVLFWVPIGPFWCSSMHWCENNFSSWQNTMFQRTAVHVTSFNSNIPTWVKVATWIKSWYASVCAGSAGFGASRSSWMPTKICFTVIAGLHPWGFTCYHMMSSTVHLLQFGSHTKSTTVRQFRSSSTSNNLRLIEINALTMGLVLFKEALKNMWPKEVL